MCLTAIGNNDFTPLVYRNCTDLNSNQDFFIEKNGPLSGKIHAQKDSKYCLQMADPSTPEKHLSVFMHSDCSDTWEVLDGRLKILRKISAWVKRKGHRGLSEYNVTRAS